MNHPRVLIVGSGLLGSTLNKMFLQKEFLTKITMRHDTTEKNIAISYLKDNFKKNLLLNNGVICNTLNDYEKVVNDFKPKWAIITIPEPSDDLLNFLLLIDDCKTIYISSPASDEAKNSQNKYPYGMSKLTHERLVNKCGQIALQIGFIPEIGFVDDTVIPSGLSLKTMLTCNLISCIDDKNVKELDDKHKEFLDEYLSKFDTTSGFVCTSIKNIFNFCCDLMTGKTKYPNELIGRTIAMHSSQVWFRHQIIGAIANPSFQNPNIDFPIITKPVKEFKQGFENYYDVKHEDILIAIRESGDLFKKNESELLPLIIQYL